MTFCNYLREEPAFLPYREGYKKGKWIKFFDVLDRYSISYGKGKGTSSDEDVPLCGRRESNPYALRHQILSLACLPISTRPRKNNLSLKKRNLTGYAFLVAGEGLEPPASGL